MMSCCFLRHSQSPSLPFHTDFNLMCSPLWLTVFTEITQCLRHEEQTVHTQKITPYIFFSVHIWLTMLRRQKGHFIRQVVFMAQGQWGSNFRNSFDRDLQAFIQIVCVLCPIHKQLTFFFILQHAILHSAYWPQSKYCWTKSVLREVTFQQPQHSSTFN